MCLRGVKLYVSKGSWAIMCPRGVKLYVFKGSGDIIHV